MTAQPEAAEAAAVARCAAGDCAALEELYQAHAPSCLCLARSVLLDTHYAEDAVQEAFLELWRHADRFDSCRSSVRGWLLLLTHRKAVDRARAEQRRTTVMLVPEYEPVDVGPGPDAQAMSTLLRAEARRAVGALEPVRREVLVLAYWGGYTQREIAALTGTPVGTVKSRMHTGMKDLCVLLTQSAEATVDTAADRTARAAP